MKRDNDREPMAYEPRDVECPRCGRVEFMLANYDRGTCNECLTRLARTAGK